MHNPSTVMLFALHRTCDWWGFLGENCGWEVSFVVTEIRNEGDISITQDFNRELKYFLGQAVPDPGFFNEDELVDIVARCRVLRWLDKNLAFAMINAMASVFDSLLDQRKPDVILSFPIDRYVSDVLERRASKRGIPLVELTASVFSGMSMLLQRGRPIEMETAIEPELISEKLVELVDPSYVAAYVPLKNEFGKIKFLKVLGYFRLRALVFKIISWWKRDRFGLHYLDAQPFLGHKCRWEDICIVELINLNWEEEIKSFSRSKRVLFGLQLFPEASIDYWVDELDLVDHEDMVCEAAEVFSNAGYVVLIKDHPLQFGFRQTDFIKRLLAIPNTFLLPYDVSAGYLLSQVGVSFNCTGTPGLQAALLGLKSVVTESYYSNEDDFIVYGSRQEISSLPERVEALEIDEPIEILQRRIIEKLLGGSFLGDLFSFQGFDKTSPSQDALQLARAVGARLRKFLKLYQSDTKRKQGPTFLAVE